jgi:hypothetical protein
VTRHPARLLLLATLLLGIAACNRPLVPPAGSHITVKTPTVRPLRGARHPVLGVDLYSKSNYPTAVVRADGVRDLSYAKRYLKVASVGIAWNLYSPANHSNQILPTSNTLTPAHVALLTRIAKSDRLSVLYRPLIKIEGPKQWEGYIAPVDTAQWFASYLHAELPYLRLAQKYHIKEFVVGTEIVQLEQSAPTSQWRWFLNKVRHVYRGLISYASWGGHFYPARQVIPPTAWYGVTAYPDFVLPDSAPVGRLVRSWIRLFRYVPHAILTRTAIQEIGIPAGDGAYHAPWNWSRPYVHNETVQVRWFLSACYAARQLQLRGIYFWNLNLTDNPANPPFSPVTFEGKRGAKAIRLCATILAQPTG